MSHAPMFRRLAAALSEDPHADMAALVEAAQVSRATLYRTVGNRDAVVTATARFAAEELAASVAHIGEDGAAPREAFAALIEALVATGPLYRFLAHLDVSTDDALRRQFDEQAAELRALIVESQRVGAIRSELSDWWVSELLDAVVWMAWSGVANGELARNHAAATAIDTFWRAVGANEVASE